MMFWYIMITQNSGEPKFYTDMLDSSDNNPKRKTVYLSLWREFFFSLFNLQTP